VRGVVGGWIQSYKFIGNFGRQYEVVQICSIYRERLEVRNRQCDVEGLYMVVKH
jgi:hypothetical protein